MSLWSCVLIHFHFFFYVSRPPPKSTPFPTRRSSDLVVVGEAVERGLARARREDREHAFGQLYHRGKPAATGEDRKSTRLNSSHRCISYAVFCLKKKKKTKATLKIRRTIKSKLKGQIT